MVFDSAKPDVVSYKATLGDDYTDVLILTTSKDALEAAQLPPVLSRGDLSNPRQQYLYSHMRPHVPAQYQDELCPKPVTTSDSSAMKQE